jgi:hypothetical protein
MRVSVAPTLLVTHTAASPTATLLGSFGTVIGEPTIFADSASIRVTVSSLPSTTQTAPSPTAMPTGWLPTLIGSPTLSFD